MSGAFFEYPGVRFSRRVRLWEFLVRAFASSLVRRVTHAACHSFRLTSRPKAAEFPAATQTAFERLKWTLRGSRAAGRASMDALRRNCNSVNIEDYHGNLFIREKLAPAARWERFPTTHGRRSPLPLKIIHSPTGGKEIALGKNHGFFHERKSWHAAGRTNAQDKQQQRIVPRRSARTACA